ncbi:MAG: formate--tetrahydrofolate ligase [Clostridia bacterium]
MRSDIEIANSVELKKIGEIASKLGLSDDNIEYYGKYKAKIDIKSGKLSDNLVLVTAINPTAFGEGKTTTSIGLADGLNKLGKSVCLALREPSLGPVFGVKGGATGGGLSQVAPMEDINLHFTGDLHAITCANNLISAIVDNHLQQGNELNLNPTKILWKRCLDMNDRALRNVVCGLGGAMNGVPREEGFNITAASEIMAVLCLSQDMADLKRRVGNIIIGYTFANEPVFCSQLGIVDAVAIVLKDALKPNLVQTLEGTPAIIHGGPFANIAHGCNSIIATKTALSLADIVVTEAGFGADLGAEKFFDIKCRVAGLRPKAVVLVATIRALKYNGGVKKEDVKQENMQALQDGICNLVGHIENIKNVYGINAVVAINKFTADTERETNFVADTCKALGAKCELCECWGKGGDGAIDLAKAVIEAMQEPNDFHFAYETEQTIEEKITAIATKVYGASGVEILPKAKQSIAQIVAIGKDKLPVCIAKTQYSFSDDATKLGRPQGFVLQVQEVQLRGGAEFLVAACGNIMLMPGLSKKPSACEMTIDSKTLEIKGLF